MYYETIADVMERLFFAKPVPESRKVALKLLSLFGPRGIDTELFREALALESKDVFFEMGEEGWLTVGQRELSLHPVIRETAGRWEWSAGSRLAAGALMRSLSRDIRANGPRGFLRPAEDVLQNCLCDEPLRTSADYQALLLCTLWNMPRDREDFLFRFADQALFPPADGMEEEMLEAFDYIVYVYCDSGDFDGAFRVLEKLRRIPEKTRDDYLWGLYYSIVGEVYDAALGGAYAPGTKREARYLRQLFAALDRAISHMKRSNRQNAKSLLAKYMLEKAAIRIRSTPDKKREIRTLIENARALIGEADETPSLRVTRDLVCAWYYTLTQPDVSAAKTYMSRANQSAAPAFPTDLDAIDFLYIPCANMMLELGRFKESKDFLAEALAICNRRPELAPYARKRRMLEEYLRDIPSPSPYAPANPE